MKNKKHIFISLLILSIAFACKKEKNNTAPSENVVAQPLPPLVVNTIAEATGNQKIYNVKLYQESYPNVQPAQINLIRDFTYTCTVTGDTMYQNNIPAKKYLHSFSHQDYSPVKSFSYVQNNKWYQVPLKSNDFVRLFSLPLPVTVGQRWGLITAPNDDTLNVDAEVLENINNVNTQCFRVMGVEKAMTNFQSYYYSYYIGTKGIVKISFSYTDITNINQMQINRYEVNLISANF